MSSGPGDKPPSGRAAPAEAGRPAADPPQRRVVRAHDSDPERASLGASDTAVAIDAAPSVPAASEPARAATTTDLVGATLSERYLIRRKIGQGGMGAVYEATHTVIGGRV